MRTDVDAADSARDEKQVHLGRNAKGRRQKETLCGRTRELLAKQMQRQSSYAIAPCKQLHCLLFSRELRRRVPKTLCATS